MRLLLVSFFYEHDHGGAEMVAREAAALLRRCAGWEVEVLCLAGGPDRGEPGMHRITLPRWCSQNAQAFKRTILFLPNRMLDRSLFRAAQNAGVRPENYDAIFCPDMNAIVLAHALADAADKPLFTWCQEVVPKRMDATATRAKLAPLINVWLRGRDAPWKKALAASTRVAGVSDFITDRCRAFAGDGNDDDKFTTLYQPVEDYFLRPPSRAVATDGPAKVLFYGRLSAEKGIDLLLAAWRKLQPHATLSILGMDGPLRPEVERATGDNIHLLQHVAHVDVPKLISQHDLVVCPSRVEESLCRTALEARLLERAIVASQSGAIPEVVNGYPLAHSTKIRTDDATAIENLINTLRAAMEGRHLLTDEERETEKSFREKFLPETFVHQFRRLTEI
ncbi:MAG: glycosyltransferase family 4 protein [Verrucomicrobia subdivision 3 bacterium]|nr:glycosyltransferase family 4 protein [Limisphaerales bacterium]